MYNPPGAREPNTDNLYSDVYMPILDDRIMPQGILDQVKRCYHLPGL